MGSKKRKGRRKNDRVAVEEAPRRRNGRYVRYMASPEWRATRARIMARASGVCERCQERPAKQVHHLTYERLGAELDEDLIAVCFPCHRAEHPEKKIGQQQGPVAFEVNDIECPDCGYNVALLTLAGPKKKFNCFRCLAYWWEWREGSKQARKLAKSDTSRAGRGKKPFRGRNHGRPTAPAPGAPAPPSDEPVMRKGDAERLKAQMARVARRIDRKKSGSGFDSFMKAIDAL